MSKYKTLEERGLSRITSVELGSKTCEKCGTAGLAWRKSKAGKWVLWQRVIVGGSDRDSNFMIEEPHFLTCGTASLPAATPDRGDGWEELPEIPESKPEPEPAKVRLYPDAPEGARVLNLDDPLVKLAAAASNSAKKLSTAESMPMSARIKAISRSLYGHDDVFPEGACPCFTQRDASHCEAFQRHVEREVDLARGK